MPRDYSKYRNEKPSSRGSYKRRATAESSSSGGMVWLLMGVLIGLCIAGFAYLNQNKVHLKELARNTLVQTAGSLGSTTSTNTADHQSKQSPKLASAQNTANTPQFDFYNMLPAGQVSGPTAEDNASSNHQPTVKTAAAGTASTNATGTATTNNVADNSENDDADNSANDATNSSNSNATNATSNKQTNNDTNSATNNSATNTVNGGAVNANSSGVSATEAAGSNSLANNEEKALTNGVAAPAMSTVALNTSKKSKKLHTIAATNDTSSDGTATPVTNSSEGSSGTAATATPTVAPNATATSAANSTVSSKPKTGEYVIQLAAFSHYDQADQLKAQLAFSGFEAKIAPLQKGKNTLQRVWMGPYSSLSAAAAVQRQLTANQMKSTLLKIG